MNTSENRIKKMKTILKKESLFLDELLSESRQFLTEYGKKSNILPIEKLLNKRQEIINQIDPLMKMHRDLFLASDQPLPVVIDLLKREIQTKVKEILNCDTQLVKKIISFRMVKTDQLMADRKNIKYFTKDTDTNNRHRISSII